MLHSAFYYLETKLLFSKTAEDSVQLINYRHSKHTPEVYVFRLACVPTGSLTLNEAGKMKQ